MKFGLIGHGAIAQYVRGQFDNDDLAYVISRPDRQDAAAAALAYEGAVGVDMGAAPDIDVVVDCAGHAGLRAHGTDALRAGIDVITVSIGALADPAFLDELASASASGGGRLYLATGAIGALDALRSAAEGDLASVRYIGRKPPSGWRGSRAEDLLDLDSLSDATIHFEGTARDAALHYPKNANVAAAVALAGVGFDQTSVRLIADPDVTENIHEIEAEGDFGCFKFEIAGRTLLGNPRTSALAAMSVVKALRDRSSAIVI